MLPISIGLIVLFIWTIINSLFLPSLSKNRVLQSTPFVSILVPMRNEENNARKLIQNLEKLTYPHVEIIILNDQSTDQTDEILEDATKNLTQFRVIQGKPLPASWVGKVHACDQLSKEANGDYFLFIDADIQLKPDTIEQALALMQVRNASLLTGFPDFHNPTWLSKLLVPMQHFVVFLHLPIAVANYTRMPATTAANGTFMFFERSAYTQMGGHKAVKNSLVEDVHIARKMKENGFRVVLTNITSYVSCQMYTTNRDTWEGFLKNIYVGLGRSAALVVGLTIFYLTFYVAPLGLLIYGLCTMNMWFVLPYLMITLQKGWIDWKTKQPLYLSFLLPFSALAFIAVMWGSMFRAWRNQPYTWKGRNYT